MSAAAAGLLDETHWVELKEAIPASSKGANLELARDLASLGTDGGVLIVGIEDNGGKAGEVVGTDGLSVLRARIDQVARSTVHPPLAVSVAEVRDPSDESEDRGCLIVSIMASPNAPHMVDHSYWGRGETGKRRLDDIEVQRYFNERRLGHENATSSLRAWVNDPSVPENTTTDGRVYVTAVPRVGAPDQAVDLLYRGDGSLPAAVREAAQHVSANGTTGHLISHATRYYRGGGHEGYTTHNDQQPTAADERGLVVVQLHEDGAVCTIHGQVATDDPSGGRIISLAIIREMLQQTLFLAADVGNRSGYYGQWDVGVHVTNAHGASDSQLAIRGGVTGASWNDGTYERVITVTSDELSDSPDHVAYRLLLPIARVLRVEQQLAASLGQAASTGQR